MHRSPSALVIALALSLAGTAAAQAPAPAPAAAADAQPSTPRTGDAWIDTRLVDVGRYASTYRDAFVDELVRYQRAPRELVVALLARPGWTPGDAYFACALAVQLGRPCREVADARDSTPKDDWAAVAQRLGIAPDAPAYDALHRAVIASYTRWGRPLPRDAAPATMDRAAAPVSPKPAAPKGSAAPIKTAASSPPRT